MQQNLARFFEEKLTLVKQQLKSFGETSDFSVLDATVVAIQEMQEVTKDIAKALREMRFLGGVIASLRKENAKLKKECENSQALHKLHQAEEGDKGKLQSLQEEYKQLQGEAKELRKENDRLAKRIMILDENNRDLIEANMQLQDQLDSAQKQKTVEPESMQKEVPEMEETAFISLDKNKVKKFENALPLPLATMVIPLDGPAIPSMPTEEFLTEEQTLKQLGIDKKQLDCHIEEKKLAFSTSQDGVRMFASKELEMLEEKESIGRLRQLFKDRIEKED